MKASPGGAMLNERFQVRCVSAEGDTAPIVDSGRTFASGVKKLRLYRDTHRVPEKRLGLFDKANERWVPGHAPVIWGKVSNTYNPHTAINR